MIALHKCDSTQDVLLTSQHGRHGKQTYFGGLLLPFHLNSRFYNGESYQQAAPLSILVFQLLKHYTIWSYPCQQRIPKIRILDLFF